MKVIFLDVDGVLVHSGTIDRGVGEARLWRYLKRIDEDCLERLVSVINRTGARIVISSTWRLNPDATAAIRKALRMKGAHARRSTVVGATPHHRDRSSEISEWLSKHPKVDQYVVLDDDIVSGHPFVHVSNGYMSGGLKDNHARQLIDLLGIE